MFLGQQAGYNSNGNYNLFVGNSSGQNTTSGSGNTAIGDGSALHNTTGQRNTSIGQYAGLNNQTGSDNVFIGYNAHAGANNPANLNNAVAIGANAMVSQDNSLVLGNNANVGIGTSAPSAKLHLVSGAANSSGLRLENLTSSSPATALNQYKFLTVDATGNVILGSVNATARMGLEENWVLSGEILRNGNAGAVVIGGADVQTPTGYKLYVQQGILTERVKVALRNTSDWSDHVFSPSYTLRPLSEVASFINANGHLPGIPSAVEMVKEGNDLQKTDARLLEKIEELTLYSIQLEKADAQLKAENAQLRQDVELLKQQMQQLLKAK